jgi:hypothetical protein
LFSYPWLFHDLMANRLWVTRILRTNELGVPMVIGQYKGEPNKRGT